MVVLDVKDKIQMNFEKLRKLPDVTQESIILIVHKIKNAHINYI